MRINGGERTGNNLFYSFEEFSISEGMEAVFENATDIENIFTRITGASVSHIEGILKTQGAANLFLVNPNGIIFGENASLDVDGSFIATTANSIQFEDGAKFTASDTESEPILTTSVPIGLQFDGDSGAITVNDTGNQITNGSTFSPIDIGQTSSNFSIRSNQILALVGNRIDLNGSVISTEGGQIYLTSLTSGLVGIKRTGSELGLSENNLTKYQDINLNQQSLINAIGEKAGIISLNGKNINLLNASFILTQNQGNLSGSSLNIKAAEFLTLSGKSPNNKISSAIRSEVLETGKIQGANIIISAQKLQLRDQGQIQTGSFSEAANGLGGDIHINVSDIVDLNSGLISASAFSEGSAGNIELSTSQLQVNNAASLTSSTTGSGNGGNIEVNADFIMLAGSFNDVRSTISASSLGTGDAGSLTISTKQLRVEDGASFSSASFGNGNAGNISIKASELITLDGKNSNFQSNNESQATTIRTSVQSIDPVARQIFRLPEVTTGNSGNLTINTPILNLAQNSVISVENQGTGNGGTLFINAENLNLDNTARITAASASGSGGNINLNTNNLQIDNGSQITAAAGNNGNGGKITINTSNLSAKRR